MRQRSTGISNLNVRHFQRKRLSTDHRNCPVSDRIRDVLMAVHPVAGGYKNISGLHLSRIDDDAADLRCVDGGEHRVTI